MIARLKRIFDAAVTDAAGGSGADAEHALRRAAASLLVEMSRADREVTAREREHVARALEGIFELPAQEVAEILQAGEDGAEAATSLYEFTKVLNERFAHEQKVHFVEQLWRIAYADGELDKHEAHLVRRVADLLHLRHREYIGGKLRAGGGKG